MASLRAIDPDRCNVLGISRSVSWAGHAAMCDSTSQRVSARRRPFGSDIGDRAPMIGPFGPECSRRNRDRKLAKQRVRFEVRLDVSYRSWLRRLSAVARGTGACQEGMDMPARGAQYYAYQGSTLIQ